MDYYRFHYATAANAAYRPPEGKNLGFSINTAIVFSVTALDAWISERAFRGVRDEELSQREYDKWMDLGLRKRWGRVLTRLHGQSIDLDRHSGRDLDHLLVLRNALVHYRPLVMESDLRATLNDMVRRGLWVAGAPGEWEELGWPHSATPEVAAWALQTIHLAAMEIRDATSDPTDRGDLELYFKP